MKKEYTVLICLFFLVLLTNHSFAQPIPIDLISTQYTTNVAIQDYDSRTRTSITPISDEMRLSGGAGSNGWESVASAHASFFDVTTFTDSNAPNDSLPNIYDGAWASAESEIVFSPLIDSLQTVTIDFTAWYDSYYSEGYVSLFDLTENMELWNYWWTEGYIGNVYWEPQPPTGDPEDPVERAIVDQDTDFIATHTYELVMYTQTNSQWPDKQRINVQVSGIEPTSVPEPSTIILIGMGLIGLAGYRTKKGKA